jgi:hypothetical protein
MASCGCQLSLGITYLIVEAAMQVGLLARNLATAFETVPDPRPGRWQQYPLRSVLALTALAALAGASSARDVSQWAKSISDDVVRDLGFPGEQVPVRDTLRRIVHSIDRAAVRDALASWLRSHREAIPDWERVSLLRVPESRKATKALLFEVEEALRAAPTFVGGTAIQATVPPLRRWKRTRAVV